MAAEFSLLWSESQSTAMIGTVAIPSAPNKAHDLWPSAGPMALRFSRPGPGPSARLMRTRLRQRRPRPGDEVRRPYPEYISRRG
jgi:hypothetical protein